MHEIKTEKYRGFVPLRVALFLLAGAALVLLLSWQMRISEKREQLATLQTEIVNQNARNEEIRRTLEALENDEGIREYAQRRAREDLDYARPGERIFVDVGGGD